MIIKVKGRKCQYEDCEADAEVIACGREHVHYSRDDKGHPEPRVYCLTHGRVVCDEGSPEYTDSCPNCGCLFGVN